MWVAGVERPGLCHTVSAWAASGIWGTHCLRSPCARLAPVGLWEALGSFVSNLSRLCRKGHPRGDTHSDQDLDLISPLPNGIAVSIK